MLNLSDKELDRLSKEAAQEYEPGDVLGPNAWEKLEMRLDSDLGRIGPNPLRHIRRFPFNYAPLLLVLLGISYYYLTKHPPTSHNLVKNSSTTQNPTYSANSTPSVHSPAIPADAPKSGAAAAATISAPTPANAGTPASAKSSTPVSAGNIPASAKSDVRAAAGIVPASANDVRASANHRALADLNSRSPATAINKTPATTRSRIPPWGRNRLSANSGAGRSGRKYLDNSLPSSGDAAAAELLPSTLQGPRPTREPVFINDSALRAFTLKSAPPGPIRRHALYIKRNWQFGIVAAPDFASVNSLAGDKPGSTLGLTVDYRFAPRWHLGSGLLLDRRNYAARSQDFHAPSSFYTNINVSQNNVDFVKGSFQMLEIPLNLRYDFSTTGSTLFFASAGVSSYVLTTDNGNCYVNWYGQAVPKGFHYPGQGNYLFSAMNLSLGVEAGISNSMSILIAPYMKMPLRTIGFGQVQMSSVGISFSLKWAPVTSRKRR